MKVRIDAHGTTKELVLSSLEDVEELCGELRSLLASAHSGCIRNSWYIRIPPEKLLALLRTAYEMYLKGVLSVGDVVEHFLEQQGLNRSLTRVITPTLSSLGLTSDGIFTRPAIELGRSMAEGRIDGALALLGKMASSNCVLSLIVDRARQERCADLHNIVSRTLSEFGKNPRKDEVAYTVSFIRLAFPDLCGDGCPSLDPRCVGSDYPFDKCIDDIYQHLYKERGDVITELFEKLDISLLPQHLNIRMRGEGMYDFVVRGTQRVVGKLFLGGPISSRGDLPIGELKTALMEIEGRVRSVVSEGMYEFYMKLVPIVSSDGGCGRLRLYVEVVRSDLERASKIVSL